MSIPFLKLVQADATREQLEEWCRARTQSYPVTTDRFMAVMCRVLGKYLMCCSSPDSALTPHLALNGIWEPWVTMAIARHLRPGMTCIDVGACYGYYSLLMADIVGPSGKVSAWEPVWDAILRKNVELNGLNIEVVPRVMSSDRGAFAVAAPNRGWFFNAGDVKMMKLTAGVNPDIAVKRAAASPPDPQACDFIKIDVEGAEADVWKALEGVRELSPDLTVCMEFTPKAHAEPAALLESIVSDGFGLGTVGHDGTPRPCSFEEALVPDTGDFRMLWLTRNR